MSTIAQLFLTVVAIGVVLGAVAFLAWGVIALVVLGWRVVGVGLRALGWQAMSVRSESLRREFVARVSRIVPLPQSGASTRTEIALEGRPPE
jgi:hypothetical protein